MSQKLAKIFCKIMNWHIIFSKKQDFLAKKFRIITNVDYVKKLSVFNFEPRKTLTLVRKDSCFCVTNFWQFLWQIFLAQTTQLNSAVCYTQLSSALVIIVVSCCFSLCSGSAFCKVSRENLKTCWFAENLRNSMRIVWKSKFALLSKN